MKKAVLIVWGIMLCCNGFAQDNKDKPKEVSITPEQKIKSLTNEIASLRNSNKQLKDSIDNLLITIQEYSKKISEDSVKISQLRDSLENNTSASSDIDSVDGDLQYNEESKSGINGILKLGGIGVIGIIIGYLLCYILQKKKGNKKETDNSDGKGKAERRDNNIIYPYSNTRNNLKGVTKEDVEQIIMNNNKELTDSIRNIILQNKPVIIPDSVKKSYVNNNVQPIQTNTVPVSKKFATVMGDNLLYEQDAQPGGDVVLELSINANGTAVFDLTEDSKRRVTPTVTTLNNIACTEGTGTRYKSSVQGQAQRNLDGTWTVIKKMEVSFE